MYDHIIAWPLAFYTTTFLGWISIPVPGIAESCKETQMTKTVQIKELKCPMKNRLSASFWRHFVLFLARIEQHADAGTKNWPGKKNMQKRCILLSFQKQSTFLNLLVEFFHLALIENDHVHFSHRPRFPHLLLPLTCHLKQIYCL